MILHYTLRDMCPTGRSLLMKDCTKYKHVKIGSGFCTSECKYNLKVEGTEDVFCLCEENEYLLLDIMHLIETLHTK